MVLEWDKNACVCLFEAYESDDESHCVDLFEWQLEGVVVGIVGDE